MKTISHKRFKTLKKKGHDPIPVEKPEPSIESKVAETLDVHTTAIEKIVDKINDNTTQALPATTLPKKNFKLTISRDKNSFIDSILITEI